ncbi:hypothetical protein SPONL_983 [uncultured Candidatus Thioglobus sp.]|nr:hypothetical protein SPONL_983 [uncultured Candidatus Thioglobus sp.]
MGVGAFLSAQYVNQCRDYLIKYRYYEYLCTKYNKDKKQDIVDFSNKIERKYNRDVWLHYIFAFLSLLTLIGFLFNAVANEKAYLFGAILQFNAFSIVLIVLIMILSFFAVIFSHTKIETFNGLQKQIKEITAEAEGLKRANYGK